MNSDIKMKGKTKMDMDKEKLPVLLYQDFGKDTDDYGTEIEVPEEDKNQFGLGIRFYHKDKFYRAAIKFDKDIKFEDFRKLWHKLAVAVANPDDPKLGALPSRELLVGREITMS